MCTYHDKDLSEKVHRVLPWFNQGALLRAIRNNLTQKEVNDALGHSFNKLSRWETEKAKLSWNDFVEICRVCGKDLRAILKLNIGTISDPRDYGAVLAEMTGSRDVTIISKVTQMKEHRLRRLFSGAAHPSLCEAFLLVEHINGGAKNLYAALMEGGEEVGKELARAAARRRLFGTHPECVAYAELICHPDYRKLARHLPGFFCRKLGGTLADEERLLELMQDAGEIVFDGAKYVPLPEAAGEWTFPGDYRLHANIISHWLKEAQAVFERTDDFDSNAIIAGYKTFLIDPETYAKVEDRLVQAYNEIGSIIRSAKSDSAKTHFRVLGIQLFDPTIARVPRNSRDDWRDGSSPA